MSEQSERLSSALSGRYFIERELGEGGMATVYVARDVKHNREVALKVLKPELAAVVGAERFLAEIETTANLKHPHILPLFDSGEVDGFLFYVMPYVEGDSLRDRLDRERQLPVDEAIRIATAVANGLQHAHDRGVVHRDIKPANILLQDGEPVIGDFGIALAVGAAGGARLTETGLSVGTPYYMSPEQATGDQVVGPATDIYALGAVLYEMLTGDPPYVARTAQAVLGKIIQGTPPSVTEVRASIPRNVDAAIRKALERLPADRFGRVQDFARALKDPGFRHGADDPSANAVVRWRRIAGATGAAALAFAALAAWSVVSPDEPEPVIRLPLTTVEGHIPSEFMALTPDGAGAVVTQVVGGSRLRPFLWRWTDLTRTMLPGVETAAAIFPFTSPDGEEVAYFDGGTLRVVAIDGGVVRTLAEDARCCGRWGHDGYIYYSPQARNIVRVPEDGGAVEEVTPAGPEGTHGHFQILPGGDAGVFTVWSTPPRLDAIRISTGERTTLTTGLQSYVTSTGHIVFATEGGNLLAARFDADALELVGSPVSVLEGVGVSADRDAFYTLSDNGSLLYWRTEQGARQSHFVWVTRSGDISPVDEQHSFGAGLPLPGWSLSPDGTRVAYHDKGPGQPGEIWIKTLPRGPLTRLTFDPGADVSPAWSPDGDTIFFASDRGGEGGRGIWARRSDGVGAATLILETERPIVDVVRGPDGGWFVFRTGGGPNGDIFAQRPGIDEAPIPVAASPDFDEVSPSLSPDGRWIAYASDETGEPQVYARPFPNVNDGRWQVSTGPASAPLWAPDGRELLYGRSDAMLSATVETQPTFRVADVRTLFETEPSNGFLGSPLTNKWYDVTSDGERLLMAQTASTSADGGAVEPQLILIQNFFQELERRLPPP